MRKRASVFGVLLSLAAGSLALVLGQQGKLKEEKPKTEQTVNCDATVPASGRSGASVQFQGTATLSGVTGGTTWGTDSIVGRLLYVPGGTFTQGSHATEACRELWDTGNERQFTHTLTKNMAVMETAVTRQMWVNLRASQGSLPADPTQTSYSSGSLDPVQSLTWYEAMLFANLLSKQQGLTQVYRVGSSTGAVIDSSNYQTSNVYADWGASGYRLPTEGEREYFTRAGTTGAFSLNEPAYSSSTCSSCTAGVLAALESVAWFCANAGDKTRPAGTKAPNPWGLKDVHGNVWEWCWDWWGSYPSGSSTNYTGPSSGSARVFRGGGWGSNPGLVRSAARGISTPGNRAHYIGFRLLKTVN